MIALQGHSNDTRFPMNWDYCEAVPIGDSAGSYSGGKLTGWPCTLSTAPGTTRGHATNDSSHDAIQVQGGEVDLILTDPPYYDAIPYSDLMDFFYVWLVGDCLADELAISTPLSPSGLGPNGIEKPTTVNWLTMLLVMMATTAKSKAGL